MPWQTRRTINLPGRRSSLPFSNAVLAGDTLYISGRIGIDPATGVVPPEVEELQFLFAGFSALLAQADMTWDDLTLFRSFPPI